MTTSQQVGRPFGQGEVLEINSLGWRQVRVTRPNGQVIHVTIPGCEGAKVGERGEVRWTITAGSQASYYWVREEA